MKNKKQYRCSGTFSIASKAAVILLASASLLQAAEEVFGPTLRADQFRRRDSSQDTYTRRNTFYCPASAGVPIASDPTFMRITDYDLGAFRTEFDKAETGVDQELAYYKVGKGNLYDNMPGNAANESFYITIREILGPNASGVAKWDVAWENAMENLPGNADKWMMSYNCLFSGPGFENAAGVESIASNVRPFDVEIRIRSKDAAGGAFEYNPAKFWTPPDTFYTDNGTIGWNVRIGTEFSTDPDPKKKVFVSCSPQNNYYINKNFPVRLFLKYLREQATKIPSTGETAKLFTRRGQIANLDYTLKGFVAGQEIYRGNGALISKAFNCSFTR